MSKNALKLEAASAVLLPQKNEVILAIDSQAEVLQKLLDSKSIQAELETLKPVFPSVEIIFDPITRRDMPKLFEDSINAEDIYAKFSLLVTLLESSETVEDIAKKVDTAFQVVAQQIKANLQIVYEQTKPFEKTVRSLSLLYTNAGGEAEVDIIPVSADKFANSSNPEHFEAMSHYMRQQYYKFTMVRSPFYITYIGDIGSISAMNMMAEVAEETRALAILDIPEMNTVKKAKDYADRVKITGISPHLAHLVIPGTWVYALNASEVEFVEDKGHLKRIEKQMAVPAASAFIGKLLKTPSGDYITGHESSRIIGISGVSVAYNYETKDATELSNSSLIMIEPDGFIQGSATANNSNNRDLRKFPKVDVSNVLLKDIVQYCNDKANSKWGVLERENFIQEIMDYLNSCKRTPNVLIQDYMINDISYDTQDEVVKIDISITFYEVADKFDIRLQGTKGKVNLESNKQAKQ